MATTTDVGQGTGDARGSGWRPTRQRQLRCRNWQTHPDVVALRVERIQHAGVGSADVGSGSCSGCCRSRWSTSKTFAAAGAVVAGGGGRTLVPAPSPAGETDVRGNQPALSSGLRTLSRCSSLLRAPSDGSTVPPSPRAVLDATPGSSPPPPDQMAEVCRRARAPSRRCAPSGPPVQSSRARSARPRPGGQPVAAVVDSYPM